MNIFPECWTQSLLWWDSYDENHLVQEVIFHFLFYCTTYSTFQSIWKSPVDMTIIRAMLCGSQ